MGIKGYTLHCGLVSPRAVNGPRVTKGLIWVERRHGPYIQWAGIILEGPDEVTGLNSDRP